MRFRFSGRIERCSRTETDHRPRPDRGEHSCVRSSLVRSRSTRFRCCRRLPRATRSAWPDASADQPPHPASDCEAPRRCRQQVEWSVMIQESVSQESGFRSQENEQESSLVSGARCDFSWLLIPGSRRLRLLSVTRGRALCQQAAAFWSAMLAVPAMLSKLVNWVRTSSVLASPIILAINAAIDRSLTPSVSRLNCLIKPVS